MASCAPSEERASSRPIEVHEPCGFALTVIEHGNPEPKFTHLDSSVNCMQNFVQMIHKLAKDIHEQKRKHPFFRGDRSSLHKDASKQCWICENEFSETDEKDLDHCQNSGGFLGWAHPQCNRARRNSNFIPVIGHNIQNYDLHHICLSLQKCEPTTTINVIPATDEKYIAMMLGVQVDRVERADKKVVPVYEYLRFVDSYKLFNGSLEKLVESLPESEFGIMESMFAHIPAPDRQLLKQKGYYPYSYMSDRSKFAERELPALSKWTNSLENGKISINESELDKAKKMWQLLNCETMQDYHDSYLKLDVALLACCSEYCRKISFQTYRLDVAQFFTAPNMAKDAALRITKARVELLTEPEHLHMIEQSVRGGITSVFETRYFKANNQFLPGFNPEEASTFGLCLDANNLYGGVMQKELLPIGSFRFANEVSISQILNMPQDSAIGYFAEVDLECPTDVHDNQRDYPLAPVKEIVQDVWLSDFQINLKEQYNIPEAKVPKLLQTLFDKKNYVVHYKLLQLYVQLGLRITKLHRVLQFNQERWLEPYITLNTNMRKNATNKFQQNYYKLMNNSVYGKTIESKRRQSSVEITRNAERAEKLVSKFEFERFKIFGENMAAMCSKPKIITWNTPTIVGATVLDLSKYYMYRFHYQVMRQNFQCRLLYSDTDSLLYRIESKDLYEDLANQSAEVKNEFDFSSYPEDHPLHDNNNKSEVLKFKYEFSGDYISEFVCLKPNMYSITSKSESI